MSVLEHEETFLINAIKELHEKEKISKKILTNENFLDLPGNEELKKKFRQSWFYEQRWPFHALVRIALEPMDTREYMYQRLIELLRKHRRKIDSHFEIKINQSSIKLPNPLADLNRLEITWKRYFEIYKKILLQLNFESPKMTHTGIIKGTINWNQTIRKSNGMVPREFVTSFFKKNYVTPENILLVLCPFWLKMECNRLLHVEFIIPLSESNKKLLKKISDESSRILKNFPLSEVIKESRKFWKFSYDDKNISKIIQLTKIRIRDKSITNSNYNNLIKWIFDFKNLELKRITSTDSQNKIIESVKDIDHVFEAWVYFEFLDFVYTKGLLLNSVYEGSDRYFIFEYNNKKIKFIYEKTYTPGDGFAWAKKHEPDFVVTIGDGRNEKIIALFDAKNYSKESSGIGQTLDKMLAYMMNLNVNFGALIYPHYPSNWDDWTEEDRKYRIKNMVLSKPEKNRISKQSWFELSTNFQKEFPRNHKDIFEDKINNRILGQLRMSPIEHKQYREFTNQTLNYIFQTITNIP